MSDQHLPSENSFEEILRRYEQRNVSSSDFGYFDVEELELIADYYLEKGRPKESSNAVELGLKLHPASTALHIHRAKVYLAMGENEKALKIVETYREGHDSETDLLHGGILVKLGRYDEADEIFKRLLKDNFDYEYTCLDIAYIYLTEQAYGRSMHYLQLGLERNSRNNDLLFELAFCYEQIGETSKSIDIYNRIIDSDPYSAEAWFNLGQVYFALDNYQKAVEAYDFVTIISDKDYTAWVQKAHALFQTGKYEAAIESYQVYLQLGNNKNVALVFIGECYEKLGDYDNAIAYYKMSLEEDDKSMDALIGLTIGYLEKNAYQQAIETAEKAISINNTIPEIWVYLAEAQINLNQVDDAIKSYYRAIEIEPCQPETLVALGILLFDLQEYEKAKEISMKAYEIDKDIENIHLLLAMTYCKLNDYKMAIPFLEQAMRLSDKALPSLLEICPESSHIINNYIYLMQ